MKTKIKFYTGKTKISFHDYDIPKEGFHYYYLSMILIESVLKKDENYFPQMFLECKYIIEEKGVKIY